VKKPPDKLSIQVTKVVNGLEMGVLSDGTAYFTGRALSNLCGVANSSISEATTAWGVDSKTTRLTKWLAAQGFSRDTLATPTDQPGVAGNVKYAYQEDISQLILEFYALDVGNPTALKNHRLLTRAGLRLFVYGALGYDPNNLVPPSWRQFHDRTLLVNAPAGHFSVFKESAPLIVAAIRAGLPVDDKTVPDISIGIAWAKHWKSKKLSDEFGEASKYDHNYPAYFAQAASNPQPMNVYPLRAIAEFRVWMEEKYIPEKFPAYIKGKVSQGLIPLSAAELFLAEITPKSLPTGSDDDDEN